MNISNLFHLKILILHNRTAETRFHQMATKRTFLGSIQNRSKDHINTTHFVLRMFLQQKPDLWLDYREIMWKFALSQTEHIFLMLNMNFNVWCREDSCWTEYRMGLFKIGTLFPLNDRKPRIHSTSNSSIVYLFIHSFISCSDNLWPVVKRRGMVCYEFDIHKMLLGHVRDW